MNNNKPLFAMEDGPELSKLMSDTAPVEKIDSRGKPGPLNEGLRVNIWSSIEKLAKDFPEPYRGHYLKAMEGKSRRAAIRANCLMCMGYHSLDVQKCTAPACPLYPYRTGGIQ